MTQKFEWDNTKNRSNIAKHGISFELAIEIFDGFTVDALDTRVDYGEVRVLSIGCVKRIAVLVVVHTDRNRTCRIISARQANTQERARYVQALQDTPDGGRDRQAP
ncbi:BrnT family toxin [uncultured Marivita sp.]|uniref:BrnT family toxin n=1 Tax=uncultured Marivita sp. TaxID=888080 RepID=UPI0026208EB5|nr:BrnT family toxin [uncultured Marivita sp.]